MHLTRGAGKDAFSTLKPFMDNRFLPLVFLTDSELNTLYEALPSYLEIFVDESNEDLTYKRNRIRKELLPLLKGEGMNFHKFYWNFHEWEKDQTWFDGIESVIRKERKSEYFEIPAATTLGLSKPDLKRVLDFYLSLLKLPPLYKAMFENFLDQFSKDRAQIETGEVLLYRETQGTIYLLRKDSAILSKPEVKSEPDEITIFWNGKRRGIKDSDKDITVRCQLPGEKMQMPFGKKELSEIFRENRIPYFIRNQIPIVYKKNLPIQVLLSMFDPTFQDYPKSISKNV